MGKWLRWSAVSVVALLLLVAAAIAIISTLGIALDLSPFRDQIEKTASAALGRDVQLEGVIELVPAFSPTLELGALSVSNSQGWTDPELVRVQRARVGVSVIPLLRGELRIDEIVVEGLIVALETHPDGRRSWVQNSPDPVPEVTSQDAGTGDDKLLRSLELENLSLQNVVISHRAGELERELRFNSVSGSARNHESMVLDIAGSIQGVPYAASMTAGSLAELLGQGGPWPLDLSASVAGLNLIASGEIADPLRAGGVDLELRVSGQEFAELGRLAGRPLPTLGAYRFSSHLMFTSHVLEFKDVSATLHDTTVTGAFRLRTAEAKPELDGELHVAAIDLRPLIEVLAAKGTESRSLVPARDPVGDEPRFDLDAPLLTLEPLLGFNGRFELSIDSIQLATSTVQNALLKVRVQDGRLEAPLTLAFAEVPFQGRLDLARVAGEPQLDVGMEASASDIGELAQSLVSIEGVEGRFTRAELSFVARGESLRSLISSTGIRFEIADAELSYGHVEGGSPVAFALEAARLEIPPDDDLEMLAKGTLLAEPFSFELHGGGIVSTLLEQQWPLTAVAEGGGAVVQLNGTVAEAGPDTGTRLELSVSSERVGGLSNWLGTSPAAQMDLDLSGSVQLTRHEMRVEDLNLRLGNTDLTGQIVDRGSDDDDLVQVELRAGSIDVPELVTLALDQSSAREQAARSARGHLEAGILEVPVLPKGLSIRNADLEFHADSIKTGPVNVSSVAFSGRSRGGVMEESTFAATVADTVFKGALAADLRDRTMELSFKVGSDRLDVGRLGGDLGLVENLDFKVGRFDLEIGLQGSTGAEMLAQSTLLSTIRDGRWTLRDPNTGKALVIGIPSGHIKAEPGKSVTMTLDGRIDDIPTRIDITGEPLVAIAQQRNQTQLKVEAEVADTRLQLVGTTARPISLERIDFDVSVGGEKLDSLNELLEVSLPPLGPYSLSGQLAIHSKGYQVTDLDLSVGSSSLQGQLGVDTTGTRPLLDVALNTPRLQLTDFRVGDWSPWASEGDGNLAGNTSPDDSRQLEIPAFLSPSVMQSFDARLGIEVKDVVSGTDLLGSGTLTAELRDGRFEIPELQLNIPGGSMEAGLVYLPTADEVAAELRVNVEQLDYGVLARRMDPESQAGGLISLDVDLTTKAEDHRRLMTGANGHMGFSVRPKNLRANVFDLWAVNLLTALLPTLDPESGSRINCVVARFDSEDGIMRPQMLLIDSTRIQASGDGEIDFRDETLRFRLVPRSKRPQMFSASTPIEVEGKFTDFGVGLRPGALIGTVVRMTTSVVTVPFQWVFTESAPRDGEAACAAAWERAP